MTRSIAGALVVVLLASCSVEEPEPSPRVLPPPLAQAEDKKETADRKGSESQETPVTTAKTGPAENAGLRADFNAP